VSDRSSTRSPSFEWFRLGPPSAKTMVLGFRLLLSMLALGLLTQQALAGQTAPVIDVVRTPDPPRIEISELVSFGDDARAPASLAMQSVWGNMVIDGQGRFLASAVGADEVLAYDAAGQYIETIGRPGEGPGEFELIFRYALDPSDSLLVFEVNELSVFSPQAEFSRQNRWAVRPDYGVVRLADGQFVVAALHRTREAAGLPFHLLSSRGELLASFGTDRPIVDPERPRLTKRLIANAGGQRFWATRPDRFMLEQWTSEGEHLTTIRGNAPWFEPWPDRYLQRPGETRPRPSVIDMASDSLGRLWIMIGTPDPEWRAGIRDDENLAVSVILDREFDTVIEVIDPATAQMVGTRRFDRYLRGFARFDAVYAYRETEVGDTVVDVWILEVPDRQASAR
jgi:6-bladed beta-propeller protein